MDLLVGISNAPHPLAPAEAASRAIDAILWRPNRLHVSRFCREATAEAMRAYSRTDAYLTGLNGEGNGGV
jgi:hypothetical protein